MTRCYIVPDTLRDAINRALDDAIAECPDAAPDRDRFYGLLLEYFNDHGRLPEFTVEKNQESAP